MTDNERKIDRFQISKIDKRPWMVTELRVDYFSRALSAILENAVVPYVEWENCGVRNRMIRRESLAGYGLQPEGGGVTRSRLRM